MRHLVASRLPYRRNRYPEQAALLETAIRTISNNEDATTAASDRRALLLIEGRATRAYWRAFSLIARCPPGWKRMYPHAHDRWNSALNIGYTVIANIVRERIRAYGLTPEIGLLHAPREGREPLVYDVEELFRQPVIDLLALRAFDRSDPENNSKRLVRSVFERLDERTPYFGGFWTIRDAIDREIHRYAAAVKTRKVFNPWRFSWSHKKHAS